MIFFKLTKRNEVILSNFNEATPLDIATVNNKRISRSVGECQVELIATDYDSKLLSNKHIANKTIDAYVQIIKTTESLRNEYKQEYTILSHNLITSHSLLQDALEEIVPEESLANAENHSAQIDIVKNILDDQKREAAESVLIVIKRAVDLQAQIEGFNILRGDKKLDIGSHNIKKVVQNILYPFYENFNVNHVEIRWHINYELAENHKIRTDYKVLNVALNHFFNNATKYTMPYSYVDINFDEKTKILSIGMMSVKIEKDELKKIFDLRHRGKNVNNVESGEGVGMYMVKKALDLLNATIIVEPDYNNHKEGLSGTKYTFNKFNIQFP